MHQQESVFRRWARDLGALRLLLLLGVVLLLIFVPAPGTPAVYGGWRLLSTVLVPVLVPIFLMVVLLDALMSRVFFADATTPQERRRFKLVSWIDLLAALALLIRWVPYYAALRA
jgi:hypothetical protein